MLKASSEEASEASPSLSIPCSRQKSSQHALEGTNPVRSPVRRPFPPACVVRIDRFARRGLVRQLPFLDTHGFTLAFFSSSFGSLTFRSARRLVRCVAKRSLSCCTLSSTFVALFPADASVPLLGKAFVDHTVAWVRAFRPVVVFLAVARRFRVEDEGDARTRFLMKNQSTKTTSRMDEVDRRG